VDSVQPAAPSDGNWPTAAGRSMQRGVLNLRAAPPQIQAADSARLSADAGRTFEEI